MVTVFTLQFSSQDDFFFCNWKMDNFVILLFYILLFCNIKGRNTFLRHDNIVYTNFKKNEASNQKN